jgi:CubicO group peptidase (beta-lactamase class C family)
MRSYKDFPYASNRAAAHDIVEGKLITVPYCNIDNLAPAGSIGSSVSDLSKWVIMLLNNGRFRNDQVVPQKAIAETRYPHSIKGNGGSEFNKSHFALYGLGFEMKAYEGRKIISHGGAVTGFLSYITLVPEENLGIVVLTNSIRNSLYYGLSVEILDAYLGLPYRNYSHFFESSDRMEAKRQADLASQYRDSAALQLPTALPLQAYAGNYANDVYDMMQVVQEKGELRMTFQHHPQMYARLESLGGNRFYVTFS